jgi:hypothetical protein
VALLEACLTVLRGRDEVPAATPVYRPAFGELFRIPEALIRMRARVADMREPRPLEAFLPEVSAEQRGEPVIVRSAEASTFVAALEPCRGAVVGLDQAEDFGTITIKRNSLPWRRRAPAPSGQPGTRPDSCS